VIYNSLALPLHSRTATTPHVCSFQWLQARNSFVEYRQTLPPTASSSSLTHCCTTGVRRACDSVMQSPSQSPRQQCLEHAGTPSPLQDVSNCLHYLPVENPNAGSSLEQERAELIQCEQHAALQETPSHCRRRIPGQTENRVPSPTPGPSQARQQQVWGSPNCFYGA
jgi:hypothetical protein